MANNIREADDAKPLVVRRGRVESVDLYEIKDTELDTLEKGTPADLQLNFAIFLLSIAFSAISALASATFESRTVETIFIVVSVAGVLLGLYLMIAWWRTRSAVKDLCKRIRQRIPPALLKSDGEDADAPETVPDESGSGPVPKG